MCFGDTTSSDIMRDLFRFNHFARKQSSPAITIAQAILGSVIILKAPLLMMPMRSIAINLLGYGSPNPELSAVAYFSDRYPWRNRCLTALLLAFCFGVTIIIPKLSSMLEISGTISCTYLSYIIPGVFLRKSYQKSVRDSFLGWFLILCGCLMGIISLYAIFFLK